MLNEVALWKRFPDNHQQYLLSDVKSPSSFCDAATWMRFDAMAGAAALPAGEGSAAIHIPC